MNGRELLLAALPFSSFWGVSYFLRGKKRTPSLQDPLVSLPGERVRNPAWQQAPASSPAPGGVLVVTRWSLIRRRRTKFLWTHTRLFFPPLVCFPRLLNFFELLPLFTYLRPPQLLLRLSPWREEDYSRVKPPLPFVVRYTFHQMVGRGAGSGYAWLAIYYSLPGCQFFISRLK